MLRYIAILGTCIAATAASALAQQPAVQVKIQESEKQENAEAFIPIDPQQRVEYRLVGNSFSYGLYVEGKRLCFSDGAIRPGVRIDGQNYTPQAQMNPLPADKNGKPRTGVKGTWTMNNVAVTQTLEVVPSKLTGKAAVGQKRRRDTLRTTYLIENKDNKAREVGIRVRIDILLVNNDGAQFASPTTHPNTILNGIELKGKTLPHWLQVLENPNLNNPGFVAYFTLKGSGKQEGPSRFLCTSHSAGDNGWDVPVMAGGDTDCVIYFDPTMIPAGGKRECVYAYGGGIATSPADEGNVLLDFGGSFELNREFTITAYVNDPAESQSLTLELPKGLQRTGGRDRQAVPLPADGKASVVLWKGRVLELGTFEVRVRSSNGVTYTRTITISKASS